GEPGDDRDDDERAETMGESDPSSNLGRRVPRLGGRKRFRGAADLALRRPGPDRHPTEVAVAPLFGRSVHGSRRRPPHPPFGVSYEPRSPYEGAPSLSGLFAGAPDVHENVLSTGERIEGAEPLLEADSARLDPAKRGLGVGGRRVVHHHHAALEPTRDRVGGRKIPRPER